MYSNVKLGNLIGLKHVHSLNKSFRLFHATEKSRKFEFSSSTIIVEIEI